MSRLGSARDAEPDVPMSVVPRILSQTNPSRREDGYRAARRDDQSGTRADRWSGPSSTQTSSIISGRSPSLVPPFARTKWREKKPSLAHLISFENLPLNRPWLALYRTSIRPRRHSLGRLIPTWRENGALPLTLHGLRSGVAPHLHQGFPLEVTRKAPDQKSSIFTPTATNSTANARRSFPTSNRWHRRTPSGAKSIVIGTKRPKANQLT